MNDSSSVLVCVFARERYAVPLGAVREVLRWRQPTIIPGTPGTVLGVIHQRGTVVPVVDVRPLLGMPTSEPNNATRLVMVEADSVLLLLVADQVEDIFTPSASPEPTPTALAAEQAQYLQGILRWQQRPIALLDVPALVMALLQRTHA